jgi:hypothetical protein
MALLSLKFDYEFWRIPVDAWQAHARINMLTMAFETGKSYRLNIECSMLPECGSSI